MKKLFFIFTVLFSLVSNSFAQSAPKAYLWEILDIYSSSVQGGEFVYGSQTSTTQNHNGEMIFRVLVKGYSSTVVSTYNNQVIDPYNIEGIDANNDGYYDMWLYYYYVQNISSGRINVQDFGTKDTIFVR